MVSGTNKTRRVTITENVAYSVTQISNYGTTKIRDSRSSEGAGLALLTDHTPLRQKCLSKMGPKNPEASLVSTSLIFCIILQSKQNIYGPLKGEIFLFYSRKTE